MNECFTACFCKLQSRDKCRLFTHTVHAGIYVRTLSPKGKLSAVCSAKKVEMEPVFDLPFSPPSTAAAAVLSSSSQHCTAHWVSCQATSVLPCKAIFCHILPFGSHGDQGYEKILGLVYHQGRHGEFEPGHSKTLKL